MNDSGTLRRAFGGRRVFLTGHTGFKGSWLALWLAELGANVIGYALPPDAGASLFSRLELEGSMHDHEIGDVRDFDRLRAAVRRARPDFVLHLAAQSLVRRSYTDPLTTIGTNVLGTANLLEAVRLENAACAIVIVTSDKCYEPAVGGDARSEEDRMGGHDVYSMTKGAMELLASTYRRSFFAPSDHGRHGVALATARAGNAIGGGDWAEDRIVPDTIRALAAGRPIEVRNPESIRPWQHVLEPLSGYLTLAAKLDLRNDRERAQFCDSWNFGPHEEDCVTVRDVVDRVVDAWGSGSWTAVSTPDAPPETGALRLDTRKASSRLTWRPRWRLNEAVHRTVDWYQADRRAASPSELRGLCLRQITDYMQDAS
jgi:CDP-glucose 4,6-dehydratase